MESHCRQEVNKLDAIIIASGSEVNLAMALPKEELLKKISMFVLYQCINGVI
ncbi:MAG: hypothetical protein ACLS85_05225 [Coprobacillus cateniformis]